MLEALHDVAPAGAPGAGPAGDRQVSGETAQAEVTGAHLARALDDLLDSTQAVTRTLLGVGVNPEDLPAGGALAAGPLPRPAWAGMARHTLRRYGQ